VRILFLAHRLPYPPNKGDKIRAFNILKHLAQRHEVVLGTLVDNAADMKWLPDLERVATKVVVGRVDAMGRKPLALSAMAANVPITVRYFHTARLQRQIDSLLDACAFDAVFCSTSPMAEYVFRSRHWQGNLRNTRKVMDLIDVDSHKWCQYAAASSFLSAWLYRYEARTLAAFEQRIAREFDTLFVVSKAERGFFPGGPPDSLLAMSNGVDLLHFSPRKVEASKQKTPTLVFTGVMDYWPNIDGVCWFVDSVLTRVKRSIPDVRLLIVGSRPTAAVRRLAGDPVVTVTGFVDDVRDYIASASVCIAPLRVARGVQNKVLEAMAMGKAVVTTAQAHEGLRAMPDRDLVVADDAAAFADAIVALLRDPGRCERIGRQARRCVEENYDWDRNLVRLREAGLE
jgi:sugar transferase (PEP-CTERM/EpsH1 system associated)